MKKITLKKQKTILYYGIGMALSTMLWMKPNDAFATCQRQLNTLTGYDGNSAVVPVGHINLLNNYLQPVNSHLGTFIVHPGRNQLAGDEKVLFICDAADEHSLYEIIGYNEDRAGSYFNAGVPSFQYTWFKYVAAKVTHMNSGQALTTTWQKVPLTNFDRVGDKIYVRGKHLSPMQVELMKVDTLPPRGGSGVSYYCGNNNNEGSGISRLPNNSKVSYTCLQPLAYTIFHGPGLNDHGLPGKDVKDYSGWPTNWYGVTMAKGAYLSGIPSCIVRNSTSSVYFPVITVPDLKKGMDVSEPFSITVECENTAISGVLENQTAVGLQVSEAAYQKAQTIGGLINSQGGVSYLVSDDYGTDPNIATGVGIQIADADNPTQPLNFIGWHSCFNNGSLCPVNGKNAGWYPFKSGSHSVTPGGDASTSMITKNYIATLKRIQGQTPKAGRVHARAYVLVKVQ